MKSALLAATFLLLSIRVSAATDDRWQYHGIRLGASMTREQIMNALGAAHYKNDPPQDVWRNEQGCADAVKAKTPLCKEAPGFKYGLRAAEVLDWQLGPYCAISKEGDKVIPNAFYCVNPHMMQSITDWIHKGHGVVVATIFVRDGVVKSIDLQFSNDYAEEFFDVADRQLGAEGWHVEHEPNFYVQTHEDTSKGFSVDRITKTKKTALYSAMMTNIDGIITHMGPELRGVLEMKVIDQTL